MGLSIELAIAIDPLSMLGRLDLEPMAPRCAMVIPNGFSTTVDVAVDASISLFVEAPVLVPVFLADGATLDRLGRVGASPVTRRGDAAVIFTAARRIGGRRSRSDCALGTLAAVPPLEKDEIASIELEYWPQVLPASRGLSGHPVEWVTPSMLIPILLRDMPRKSDYPPGPIMTKCSYIPACCNERTRSWVGQCLISNARPRVRF